MADFSFGGEGLLQAITLGGQLQQQQVERMKFQEEQALFPLRMAEQQAKSNDEQIKFLKDHRTYTMEKSYDEAVKKAVQSGKFKGLTGSQTDSALAQIALDNDMPAQAAEYTGKAATTAKDEYEVIDKRLTAFRATKDIVASHLDAVKNQQDLNPAIDNIVFELSSTGAGMEKGPGGKTLIDQLNSLKDKQFEGVKKQFGERIYTAEQTLTAQRNAVLNQKDKIDMKKLEADTEITEVRKDILKMQKDFMDKHDGRTPAQTAGELSDPYASAVLGALQTAGISIPGGMNGKQLESRINAIMSYVPRFEGEGPEDYADRVLQANIDGHAGFYTARTAAQRIGTTVGAIKIGSTAITEKGGLSEQYLEAISKADYSNFRPMREGEKFYGWLFTTPEYTDVATAAQGIASDYAQVMARGGRNVDSQVVSRELINQTSPEAAQVVVNRLIKEMEAVERAGTSSTPKPRTGRDQPAVAPASGWGPARVVN